jgi:hypothetical protein
VGVAFVLFFADHHDPVVDEPGVGYEARGVAGYSDVDLRRVTGR